MENKHPERRRSAPHPASLPKRSADSVDGLLAELDTTLPAPSDEALDQLSPIKPKRKMSLVWRIILIVCAVILLGAAAALGWYQWALGPVSASDTRQSFIITSGETPAVIATHLEEARLIRSKFAFELYTKFQGVGDALQAGTYKLAPNQAVAGIVGELVKGQNATYNVLIPPGLTLKQLADPSVKGSFAAQGFSAEEIEQAFSATYPSALLKDKPADASLEGYIFPETFQARESDSLQSILERSFDTLYERLETDGLVQKFAAQGLTLHQALTLASIVQMEVSNVDDQAQVAQVFLKRLADGMLLGSDVTALYGAIMDGVVLPDTAAEAAAIAVAHNSPYNTRLHAGLPPGPIANMNFSALNAVANPALGDYLFFVAGDGDDAGTTFFSRTYEEHQAAIAAHCHTLCN